jgi:hypothetical protein
MVSLHMILLIRVYVRRLANISDCVMSSGWLMSGERNGKKYSCYNALMGSTITRFSLTDWLRTISMTDRYPADCRTERYQSEVEKSCGLKRSGGLHIINWSEFWRYFIFSQLFRWGFFNLQYKFSSMDSRFPTSIDNLVVCNSQQ